MYLVQRYLPELQVGWVVDHEPSVCVVLEVDKSKAYYFENKKYLKSQEEKKQDDGSLLVSFKVTQEMEIEELVKRWIPFVKVIEPKSLKQKIKDDLVRYL